MVHVSVDQLFCNQIIILKNIGIPLLSNHQMHFIMHYIYIIWYAPKICHHPLAMEQAQRFLTLIMLII